MKMMDEDTKRSYRRRSDEERLNELQDRLSKLKERVAERKRKDSPLHRELSRTRRTLRSLAQTAQDNGRADISNSTLAFLAGLERMIQSEPENGSARGRASNGA
jgi:molecular chaperone GrpE (heat shock protein)